MKTKILLVDDEEDLDVLIRQYFRPQIRAQQYEFFYAANGLEALAVVEQQPDLAVVLSDIKMPVMDGLTLLSKLAEINPLIRTVIVTAYGDSTNIRTAMNRGAFDFITKPINLTDLDITLAKTIRHVEQLRETAELKAVDEMKTRFFANITHELRTPLSLIMSPVDKLLGTDGLPMLFQQQLSLVQRSARQLLRLINQLLDINKLEARRMDLVQEVGDLPDFVSQIVDLFRPSTDIKRLTLTYHTELESGQYKFDADKWEKILYNLLANAVKFTPEGEITVHLAQLTPAMVQLSITDTGIGIPAHRLPHIFDRFYQVGPRSVDDARTRAYEGTGIGLALVQELMHRLGGTIEVRSMTATGEGESGTRFSLQIPVDRCAPTATRPAIVATTLQLDYPLDIQPDAYPTAAADTPLVLVVEDNAELREFIVAELATTYRIRVAANGEEGWLVAQDDLPDVIISDLMMPRLDGFGLVERIKNDPATDHIATILLTASAGQENRLKGLDHGADQYLTKPFHMGELLLRLRNLLQRQANLRRRYQQALTHPSASSIPDPTQSLFLDRLYALIDQRLDDSGLSVEWLADQLAVSRKTLYLKVQSLLHLSPVELIRQYRLGKATTLLRAGHSASETAYLVGFESTSYFSKVFREMYQETPTDYIKH